MSDTLKPTDAELALLRILWSRGPSTVREVYAVLTKERTTGYTTVLKTFQIMSQKGLVARDTSQRSHIYTPVFSETEVQDRFVDDIVAKAFGGSASRLVMRALSDKPADPKEIAEIRAFLDSLERDSS